jgi:plastocyanin
MTTAQLGVIVAACVAMAAFAAAVVQAQEPTMSLPNATVTADFGAGFQPTEVVIPAGGTVEWKNASFFARAVTDDPALAHGLVEARLPAGAQPFDSGAIAPGGAWRRSFTVPGRYVYFSRQPGRHTGVVIVR